MAENKKSVNGLISRFAMLADELVKIYPNSKSIVVFSLNDDDYNTTKMQVEDFTPSDQFKIDISGTEFIFLKETLLNNVEDKK